MRWRLAAGLRVLAGAALAGAALAGPGGLPGPWVALPAVMGVLAADAWWKAARLWARCRRLDREVVAWVALRDLR